MADSTIQIPITATFRIVNGEAVQMAAEYADMKADDFAQFLIKGLGGFPVPRDPAD